jgi:gluconokinase
VATVLALDVGSSSVRARRFDEHAEPVDALRRERYAGDDPVEIVRLVRAAVGGRDAAADAVGCSSFGHSLIALDAAGRPLTPLLGWRDTRSAAAAVRLRDRVDPAAVRARTGAYLHPSFWPAKLVWLAEAEPDVFRSAARFVSFADYLYAQLHRCEPATSSSIASGTGLFDLTAGQWDAELLEVLGVDEERLPALSNEPQDGWYPALIDGACSNLGAGCTGPARAALMIGTSGALRILHETERPEPRPGLFLYVLDERRVVEGGALSDGGNLYAWLNETLGEASGSVLECGPDEHGLAFLPLLGGERSTGWRPDATGAIDGLTFATTARDIRQAALEGVGFRFAAIADRLPEIEEVVATGGGLRSDPDWIQLLADALARPITASGVEEASLRGAAVATLERLGHEAPPAPLGRVFHPRPERADAYRSARERQQRLYDGLYGDD